MFENIRMISCDIDGTLTEKGTPISDRTIECIEKLRAKGILFGIATGRKVMMTEPLYEKWGLSKPFDFIIGLNGAEVGDYINNKRYNYNLLSRQQLKEIVEMMIPYGPAVAQYGKGDAETYCTNDIDDYTSHLLRYNNMEIVMVDDMSYFYSDENGGIMLRFDEDVSPELYQEVIDRCRDKDYKPFLTQSFLIEFSHRNTNKGYALERLMEIYGIKPEQCLSFGDTSNDNEMLEKSIGVCLANGTEDTKKVAKYITDKTAEESGFAEFIFKNMNL